MDGGWASRGWISATRRAVIVLAGSLGIVAMAQGCAGGGQSAVASSGAEISVIGEDVSPAGGGLYRVELPGEDLITHGPDPIHELGARKSATRDTETGFGLGDAERPPACAEDFYQHVLYSRPTGSPDRYATVVSGIRASIRRMNAVLNRDALESGGVSADYKVLCDANGAIRIDSFTTSGSDFQSIVTAARLAGFNASNADYTIFHDASSGYCGVASYQPDERLIQLNPNNNGGGYAINYRDCWLTETPMHENGHNQGAVQYQAPYSTGSGGHCYDEFDVMCYSPDGGDRNQGGELLRCDSRVRYDCGYDDYFDAEPEPGEYLATSWNIGSRLNRFVVFGTPPSTDGATGGGGSGGGSGGDESTGGESGGDGSSDGSSVVSRSSRVIRLRTGRTVRRLAASKNGWRDFVTRVPKGTRVLRVALARRGPSNLDLYLQRGGRPTLREFDCGSTNAGSRESCRLRVPLRGRWYAGVKTRSGQKGKFAIRATLRR